MSKRNVDEVIRAALEWIDNDCDERTRGEAQQLVADAQHFNAAFSDMLEFGTAGLRGSVGPGPSQMNHAMIRITTWAVGTHFERLEAAKGRPVLLGYDARLSSRGFAETAAGVLAAMGLSVRFFEEPVPTPLVAYAQRRLNGCAGIVVTASHNPKEDNGYKLYGLDAIQIVTPVDSEVAELMASAPPARDIQLVEDALSGQHPLVRPVDASLVDEYFADVEALRPRHGGARDLGIVYTPVHGVGGRFVEQALATAGFTQVHVVKEQAEPDGNFPTAPKPNPQDPIVLGRAEALARECNASLVLANDPDADRLAVSTRDSSGEYRALTGNQIGILLADYVLSKRDSLERGLVACSIVSTPMIERVARAYGVHCETTFTGFKWVWTAALDLQREQGCDFVFGFEEALGYCVGQLVRDKDGVSAALLFAELAAELADKGESVLDRMEQLYRRHGLWVSAQASVRKEPPQGALEIAEAMERVGNAEPSDFDGIAVTAKIDYRQGAETRPRWRADDDLIQFDLEGGGRALVRPSGTEPLLKFYVDLPSELGEGVDVWAAEGPLQQRAKKIADELKVLSGLTWPKSE